MALSRIVHIGDGVTRQFAIPFALGYLSRDDIKCRVGTEVDGVGAPSYRTLNFLADELVEISGAAPGVGVKVLFDRTVSEDYLLVDFENNAVINEDNLNTAQKQAIMLVHQALDGRFAPLQQNLDINGYQIINLVTPTLSYHAATKEYVDTFLPGTVAAAEAAALVATQQAGLAAGSAGASAASASAAGGSAAAAGNAATSAAAQVPLAANQVTLAAAQVTAATTQKTAAQTAATLAQQWATAPYNTVVAGGQYSALHWATVAQNTVTQAITDAVAALPTFAGFTGTAGSGNKGLVPAPTVLDTYLASDGTWKTVTGGAAGRMYIKEFPAVTGNGTTDDTAALQAAINAAQNADKILVLDPAHRYRTTAPLTFKQGQATTGKRWLAYLDGNGCTFLQNHNGYCLVIEPQCEIAGMGTGRAAAPWYLKNFNLDGRTYPSTTMNGILVGREDRWLDVLERQPALEDIMIVGYRAIAIKLESCRHFDVNRVTVRDPTASPATVQVINRRAGSFTGDITFNDCEFAGNRSLALQSPALYLYAKRELGTTNLAQTRGIRFQNCVFYGSATQLVSDVGGQLADVWFSNCAWDQTNVGSDLTRDMAIDIQCHNAGEIDKVFFTDLYMVGYAGGGVRIDGTGGTMASIQFKGGAISSGKLPFRLIQTKGVSILGMEFTYNTGADNSNLILANDNLDFIFSDNHSSKNTGIEWMISAGGSGLEDRYVITNNVATDATLGCINDFMAYGKQKYMTNNVRLGLGPRIIASADPLVIPEGDVFFVSGNVGFGTMKGVARGRRVTLIFQGTLSIFSGTGAENVAILTGSSIAVSPNKAYSFVSDGFRWFQT